MICAQFEADAYPTIGARLTRDLSALDVLDVVQAVEKRGRGEQASRLLQRIKSVFRHAVIHTRSVSTNVTLDLVPAEVLKPRKVKHRPALPESELPTFWEKLAAYDGDPGTVNALMLLMYCVPRPGELRQTPWAELPPGATQWRIPAPRMKKYPDDTRKDGAFISAAAWRARSRKRRKQQRHATQTKSACSIQAGRLADAAQSAEMRGTRVW